MEFENLSPFLNPLIAILEVSPDDIRITTFKGIYDADNVTIAFLIPDRRDFGDNTIEYPEAGCLGENDALNILSQLEI